MSLFSSWCETFLTGLLWLSVQGSLLLALVALVLFVGGRWIAPRWRYLAWSLVVVRFLLIWGVPSPFSVFNVDGRSVAEAAFELGHGGFSAIRDAPPSEPMEATWNTEWDAGEVVIPSEGSTREPLPPFPTNRSTNSIGDRPVDAPTEYVLAATEDVVPEWQSVVWPSLFFVWLSGAFVHLGRLGIGQWRLNRRVAAIPIPEHFEEKLRSCCDEVGLRKAPLIRVVDEIGPAVGGLWQPTLYVPRWMLAEADDEQTGMILRHELTHLKRGDIFVLRAMHVARIVHWFNPAIYWLNRCLLKDCELACDAQVVAMLNPVERRNYATALLRVVERSQASGRMLAVIPFSRPARQLKGRLEMIQRFRPPSMRQQLTGLLLILVLAFVGLTNGMAQSPNGPDAKDKPVPQSEDQPIEKEGAQAETIRVSGTCRDFEGNTVAEADVRVFRRLRPFGKIKTVFQTRTDEFGQFEIELTAVDLVGKSGKENGALAIRSDQHVSQLRFLNPDYPAEDLEITLFPRGGLLSGKVLRPDGQPQAGVWVYFPNALGAPVPDMQSAITDDAGEFQIADGPVPKADVEVLRANEEEAEGFEFTSVSFVALHPDFPDTLTMIKPEQTEVTVTLAEPATVMGQVIDAVTEEPVPNCRVSAQGVEKHGWHETTTNENGEYRLLTTADKYNIWAEVKDRMPIALDSFQTVAGEEKQAPPIRMMKGAWFTGRIIDVVTGEPVVASPDRGGPIFVAHYGPSRPHSGAAVTSAKLDENGRYRLHVAPGKNRIYLMHWKWQVIRTSDGDDHDGEGFRFIKDGDTKKLDFYVRYRERAAQIEDRVAPAQPIAQEAVMEASQEKEEQDGRREWPDTKVGLLLRQLDDLQRDHKTLELEWERTLRLLILLGPDAVPELIQHLDETPEEDRLMLRSIPFVLRGIGDKRAIPALIRAIPKCVGKDGSDYGARCKDPELMAFLQKHDNSDRDDDHYSYGRPVNEILPTLQRWTGQTMNWTELSFATDNDGTARQTQLQKELFHRLAKRWAKWWEANWQSQIDDVDYQHVNLPPGDSGDPLVVKVHRDRPLERYTGRGNMVVAPVQNEDSGKIFVDLDTGRWGGLPQHLRGHAPGEIEQWAKGEGFDLMGVTIEDNGQPTAAIQTVGLKTWKIGEPWSTTNGRHSVNEIIENGEPATGVLEHGSDEHCYFFQTNEGTIGKITLGAEVTNTKVVPGAATEDDLQRTVGLRRGRRMNLGYLRPIEP